LLLSTRGTAYLSALRARYSWMSRMLPMYRTYLQA
jgi:hypothetical protein